MKDVYYSKETMDAKMDIMHELIKSVDSKVDIVTDKVSFTNGKVRAHEKILLVFGAVVGTLLIVNASPFVTFLDTIIK